MSTAETQIDQWLRFGNTHTTLYIEDDLFITTLPHIPDTVQRLVIDNCERLVLIPQLPASLLHLQIDKCPRLEALPMKMPPRLFYCSLYGATNISLPVFSDNLTHLFIDGAPYLRAIDVLPSSLEELYIRNTPIEHLPTKLPPNLRKLVIPHGDLHELPYLPDCLDTLHVRSTHITSLYQLPHPLRTLNVSNSTNLRELQPILPPFLTELYVRNTALTDLPELPIHLRVLFIDSTPIHELPSHLPPHLSDLSLVNTQIKVLPFLSQELSFLNIEKTPIKRLKAHQFSHIDSPCVVKTDALSIEDFLNLPSNIHTIEFTNPEFQLLDIPVHLYFKKLGPFDKPPPRIKFKHNGKDVEFEPHPYITHESLLELKRIVEMETAKEKARIIQRTRIIKEDLMIKTWHPSRVEDWCGVRFDNMDD